MSSSLPPPPTSSVVVAVATRCRHGGPPAGRILGTQSPLHPRVCLRATRSGKGGADETTWCQRHLHSHLSLAKWLNPQMRKVRRISSPISPFCSNTRMIYSRGCSLEKWVRATLCSQLGWGMGRPPVNAGSGTSASFFNKNHDFHHTIGGSCCGMEK
jgi:hypothetical protein